MNSQSNAMSELGLIVSGFCPAYLKNKRWFLKKNSEIKEVTLKDCWTLKTGQDRIMVNSIIDVSYKEGRNDLYFLPFAISTDDAGVGFIYRVSIGGFDLSIYDTGNSEEYFAGFMDSLWSELKLKSLSGGNSSVEFVCETTQKIREIKKVDVLGGELSNTIVILDKKDVVKIYRHLNPGINPDLEVYRQL
ncbi:MAG: hypothetical protein AB1633_05255, partial [Elusimicrobiota bacterium]